MLGLALAHVAETSSTEGSASIPVMSPISTCLPRCPVAASLPGSPLPRKPQFPQTRTKRRVPPKARTGTVNNRCRAGKRVLPLAAGVLLTVSSGSWFAWSAMDGPPGYELPVSAHAARMTRWAGWRPVTRTRRRGTAGRRERRRGHRLAVRPQVFRPTIQAQVTGAHAPLILVIDQDAAPDRRWRGVRTCGPWACTIRAVSSRSARRLSPHVP